MNKLVKVVCLCSLILACGDDALDNGTGNGLGMDPGPNQEGKKGTLQMAITDAPIDNAEVKSCFLTISEVKVDGVPVQAFQKTTIDVLAYQNGKTFDLGSHDVDAKTYSTIDLVLDFDSNMTNNGPGCYIEDQEGNIHTLTMSDNTISLRQSFMVEENQTQPLLFDVDLRKSIRSEVDGSNEFQYQFVTRSEFEESIRVVKVSETSVVKGTCTNQSGENSVIVAYAYAAGTFDKGVELSGQGQSQIEFKNAINSSICDASGKFEMHYLQEGDYDLYFAAYDTDSQGHLQIKGLLTTGGLLNAQEFVRVSLAAQVTTDVDITLTGLLGL